MTTHPLDQNCLQKRHIEASRTILVVLMISLFFISAILLLLYFYTKFYFKRHQVERRAAIRQVRMNTAASSLIHSTAEPPKTTGLDPSVIALLPLFLYKLQEGKTRHECAVCLSNFEEEEITRLLPNCNHLFHAKCVDEWLSCHTSCPICRAEAKPTDRAQRADVGAEGVVEELVKVGGLESRLGSFGRSFGSRERSLGERRELDGCERVVVGSGDHDDIDRQ